MERSPYGVQPYGGMQAAAEIRQRRMEEQQNNGADRRATQVPAGTNSLSRPADFKAQFQRVPLAQMGTPSGTRPNGQAFGGALPPPPPPGALPFGLGAPPKPAAAPQSPPASPAVGANINPFGNQSASVLGILDKYQTPGTSSSFKPGTVTDSSGNVMTQNGKVTTPKHPSGFDNEQQFGDARRSLQQGHPEIFQAGTPQNQAFVGYAQQHGEQAAHQNIDSIIPKPASTAAASAPQQGPPAPAAPSADPVTPAPTQPPPTPTVAAAPAPTAQGVQDSLSGVPAWRAIGNAAKNIMQKLQPY